MVQNILQSCCPTCPSAQCTVPVQGLCCAFSASATTPGVAIAQYEQAVQKYKQACPVVCPGTPCPPAPSNVCNAMTSLCE